jgi:uncharacterized lipoprotein YmbA
MSAGRFCWVALLFATACSASPEPRYYTLTAEPAVASSAGAVDRAAYALDAVAIPDLLDRPQIVLRVGQNRVEMLDDDRWAAPLPDLLRRTIAADLSRRLGASAIIDPGLPAGRSARRITVSILEFSVARDGQCVLAASWSVSGGTTHRSRHTAAANRAEVTQMVATMSDLLAALADDIAATLTTD